MNVHTYMYVHIATHIFCTVYVIEPHTMYETCQSGLNCNVVKFKNIVTFFALYRT